MKDYELLGRASVGTLLAKYSIPAIIGMLVNALYNIVDRIFIGNIPEVGSMAISGLGLSLPIMTVILAFGMLISLGATTNISIKLGQKDIETAQKLIGNAIALCLIVGAILMVLGLVFLDQILYVFGASDNTIIYAEAYIKVIFLGIIFNMVSFGFYHMIRADGNPAISATILVSGAITNIILDYVFIFKFNMGIAGAAYATIISQALTAIASLIYFISSKSNLKIRLRDLKVDKDLTKMTFAIGMSPFAVQLAASTVQIVANHALKEYGGDLAIGAMTTVMSVVMMFMMPLFGINQGSQPIVGYNYGAKNGKRVLDTYKLQVTVAFFFLLFGLILTRTYPREIVSIFNKDPKLMKLTIDGLYKMLIILPIASVNITGSYFVQSLGKAKTSMFLSLLRQVLMLIPLMLILPHYWGLDGVWYAQPIADVFSFIITVLVLIKQFRIILKLKPDY